MPAHFHSFTAFISSTKHTVTHPNTQSHSFPSSVFHSQDLKLPPLFSHFLIIHFILSLQVFSPNSSPSHTPSLSLSIVIPPTPVFSHSLSLPPIHSQKGCFWKEVEKTNGWRWWRSRGRNVKNRGRERKIEGVYTVSKKKQSGKRERELIKL